jgi:cbb3-type cytochrome oxidase maturation protein
VSVLYIVVPLALVIVAGALWAFIWATRTGQFDDLTTPGVRVLFDDEEPQKRHAAETADNPGDQDTQDHV